MTVTNSNFTNNSAIQNGGVIALLGVFNQILFQNVIMTGNTAGNFGGAIYSASTSLMIINFNNVVLTGSSAAQVTFISL